MDLVTLAPRASAMERAAVDGVVGPATSRWEGGDRDVPSDDRFALGGHAARDRRHLLLPVFHAIQARVGWISQPALEYACRLAGAGRVIEDLEQTLGPAGELALDGEATWIPTPCLGRCERGPTALFTVAGLVPETIAAAPVDAALVIEELVRSVAS